MLGHCMTNAAVLCFSLDSSLTCLSLLGDLTWILLRMGQWSLTVQGHLAAFSAFPLTVTVEQVVLLVSILSSPCNSRAS